jgi:hypothetical protein
LASFMIAALTVLRPDEPNDGRLAGELAVEPD